MFKHFNPTSATWQVLEKHIRQERELLIRDLIDCKDHDASQILRGRIQQLDALLDLPTRLDNWEPSLTTP